MNVNKTFDLEEELGELSMDLAEAAMEIELNDARYEALNLIFTRLVLERWQRS
jgi:hypothetical protein